MKRSYFAVLFAMGTLLAFGCQSSSNPWSGKAYQEPSSRANPAQSTYAPMPSILPSLKASTLMPETTDESTSEKVEPEGLLDLDLEPDLD